jgi:hypothetical protein
MSIFDQIDARLAPAVLAPSNSLGTQLSAYLRQRGQQFTVDNVVAAITDLHSKGLVEWLVPPAPPAPTKAQRDAASAEKQRQQWRDADRAAKAQGRNVSDGSRLDPATKIEVGVDSRPNVAATLLEGKAAAEARVKADAITSAADAAKAAESKAQINTKSIIEGFTPAGDRGILFGVQSAFVEKMNKYLVNAQKDNLAYVLHDDGTYTEVRPFTWVAAEKWIAQERLREYKHLEDASVYSGKR